MDTMRANKEFYRTETARDVLARFFASDDDSLDLACSEYLLRFAKGPQGDWRFANEASASALAPALALTDDTDVPVRNVDWSLDAVRRFARACAAAGRAAYTAQQAKRMRGAGSRSSHLG